MDVAAVARQYAGLAGLSEDLVSEALVARIASTYPDPELAAVVEFMPGIGTDSVAGLLIVHRAEWVLVTIGPSPVASHAGIREVAAEVRFAHLGRMEDVVVTYVDTWGVHGLEPVGHRSGAILEHARFPAALSIRLADLDPRAADEVLAAVAAATRLAEENQTVEITRRLRRGNG